MTDINDLVEENAAERFYVYRGHKGARAIELVYHGHRWVFDEGSKAASLTAAKTALRIYKALHGLDGFWPSHRWATLTPVNAKTRDAELRALAEIDLIRFSREAGCKLCDGTGKRMVHPAGAMEDCFACAQERRALQ